MSHKHRHGNRIPSEVLCKRLDVLSDAVTEGRKGINREFYMSIPAQRDIDADLILSDAADRIREFEKENAELQEIVNRVSDGKEVNCRHASGGEDVEECDCWSCKADELWRRWFERQKEGE